MSYAANLGRNEIIKLLHNLGAKDHVSAAGRAVLQSKIDTARMIQEMMGSPPVPEGALGGPAYTLSVSGTAFLFEFGARVLDANGKSLGRWGEVGSAPGQFKLPHMLCVDSKAAVYVTEVDNKRLQKFEPAH